MSEQPLVVQSLAVKGKKLNLYESILIIGMVSLYSCPLVIPLLNVMYSGSVRSTISYASLEVSLWESYRAFTNSALCLVE